MIEPLAISRYIAEFYPSVTDLKRRDISSKSPEFIIICSCIAPTFNDYYYRVPTWEPRYIKVWCTIQEFVGCHRYWHFGICENCNKLYYGKVYRW